jgi:gamma-glutamylcyclotransferase (GGCT)/AIG2-like uncharacterized protein YtfP
MGDSAVSAVDAALFVYGTLRPGESRWAHLAPFVVDQGWPDAVAGRLFDTGHGYPAARFAAEHPGRITGQTLVLLGGSLDRALHVLDEIEGAVWGLYRRVTVTTERGVRAFAYEYGDRDDHESLRPIPSGDWRARS